MFRDPVLESAGVAGYQWGSFLLETTALFQADGRTIVEAFAGAAGGTLPFDSAMQMRTALAILHELVHLKQDLGTGLGAHDHLVTRAASLRLLAESRWLITKYTNTPYHAVAEDMLKRFGPSPTWVQIREDLATLRTSTVGMRQLRGESWLVPATRHALSTALGAAIPDEDLLGYSLRGLLEGEAASGLYGQVATSRVSVVGKQLLEEYRTLWDPFDMGKEYYRTIIDVARAMGRDVDGSQLAKGLLVYTMLVEWAVDYACAYPPSSLLTQGQLDAHLFDPVVRFVLVLRAFALMPEAPAQSMLEALVSRRWAAVEQTVAEYVPIPYPTTTNIYKAWVGELQPLADGGEWDAPLLGLRLAMCKTRVAGGPMDALRLVFDSEVPIQLLVQNTGIRGILWGRHYYDDELKKALLLHNVDRELLGLFHGAGLYRCPYGRADLCDGRTPACSTGLVRVAQFPPEEQCGVRKNLMELGFAI